MVSTAVVVVVIVVVIVIVIVVVVVLVIVDITQKSTNSCSDCLKPILGQSENCF